jgi:hypothetical protein
LIFNCALEYASRRVQVNQDGWKLNGTHKFLVYADGINILGRSVHSVKENTKSLIVVSTEIGRKENADKTKYMLRLETRMRDKVAM